MKNIPLADLRGYARLAADATLGVTDIVQSMHQTILRLPLPLPLPLGRGGARAPTGLHGAVSTVLQRSSGLVYGTVRLVTRGVAGGLDAALGGLQPAHPQPGSPPARDAALAVVNGVLGDHLQQGGNPLLITMGFRRNGGALELSREALRSAITEPSGKLLVLLHGHCMNDLQWCRNGHNHGEALARSHGFTALYLRYNTGLHISRNGRELSELLEQLVCNWPVPVQELCIVGYSMGGLLARSALHCAGQEGRAWQHKLGKLLFVGAPHHGSRLEQAGNLVDKVLEVSPYSRAMSRLGKIRSAGTTDLRHGNLVDADWMGQGRFAHFRDRRQVSQLPANVACYAIAAVLGKAPGELRSRLLGDGLVPLRSALGQHKDARRALQFAPDRQRVVYGTSHLGLLDSQEVCAQLQSWLASEPAPRLKTRRQRVPRRKV